MSAGSPAVASRNVQQYRPLIIPVTECSYHFAGNLQSMPVNSKWLLAILGQLFHHSVMYSVLSLVCTQLTSCLFSF